MTTTGAPRPSSNDATLASLTAAIGYGGLQATIISAVALVISGFSLYESTFKTSDLEVFVPPVIHYARDNGGDVELFAIPITITNGGARTGTVLSMQLDVEDLKSHKTKRYYSAFLGEHQVDPSATNARSRRFRSPDARPSPTRCAFILWVTRCPSSWRTPAISASR